MLKNIKKQDLSIELGNEASASEASPLSPKSKILSDPGNLTLAIDVSFG